MVKDPLLVLPDHPYLYHNKVIPEWEMTKEAVTQHILSCSLTTDQITQIYKVILSQFLEKVEILDYTGNLTQVTIEGLLKRNFALNLEQQKLCLGYNVYNFLASVRKQVGKVNTSVAKRLSDEQETIAYARLLSKKPVLQIMRAIDNQKNSTQLARQLKIARPNFSQYLHKMRKQGMVDIMPDGTIVRKIKAIAANFEVG